MDSPSQEAHVSRAGRARRRGMFDAARLKSMKYHSFLVNVSRGAIVDRQALADALEEGYILGYAGAPSAGLGLAMSLRLPWTMSKT